VGGTRAELLVTGSSGQVPAYFRKPEKTILDILRHKCLVSGTCPKVGRKFRLPKLPANCAGTSSQRTSSFNVRGTEDLLRGVSGRKFRLKGPELLPEEKNQQLLQFCHSNSPAMFILLDHVPVYINTHKYIPSIDIKHTKPKRARNILSLSCQ
jgi:hypothetical protein